MYMYIYYTDGHTDKAKLKAFLNYYGTLEWWECVGFYENIPIVNRIKNALLQIM